MSSLTWEEFIQSLYEGLDGIDYKTAKRVHKALYPEATVRVLRNARTKIEVNFPVDYPK